MSLVQDKLPPLLDENKPRWMTAIELHTFNLGDEPPQVNGVKVIKFSISSDLPSRNTFQYYQFQMLMLMPSLSCAWTPGNAKHCKVIVRMMVTDVSWRWAVSVDSSVAPQKVLGCCHQQSRCSCETYMCTLSPPLHACESGTAHRLRTEAKHAFYLRSREGWCGA